MKAAGFDVVCAIPNPRPGDVVCCWNRYGRYEAEAKRFEAAGALPVIIENGYLGNRYNDHAKPFTAAGDQLFALGNYKHNGAGEWPVGEPGRWRSQGIEVKPWRTDGEHVLVLPQRGIGPAGVAMPHDWPQKAVQRLRTMTKRPVRLRAHPGNNPSKTPLEDDLAGCWAAVTWGSCAALKAICAGVPVFADFPKWIGLSSARLLDGSDIEWPRDSETAREGMLDQLAWAQASVAEISTGEPFRRLMEIYDVEKAA